MSIENPYDRGYAEAQARNIPKPYKDLVTRFLAPWKEKSETTTILECGSGFGDMMRFIRGLGFNRVFGVDINHSVLHISGEKGNTVTATIHDQPFANDSMDASVSFHTLEHTVGQGKHEAISNLHTVFSELARITKNDGRSLLVFPNPWVNRREGALVDTLTEEKLHEKPILEYPRALIRAWAEAGKLHPHRLTRKMIREALRDTPWQIEQYYSMFVGEEGGRSWVLELRKR